MPSTVGNQCSSQSPSIGGPKNKIKGFEPEKMRILTYTRYEMLNKALDAFRDLNDDEELGPADWPTVERYITCLNNLDEGCVHPHNVSESEVHLQTMNLRDIRIRLLNGVQAAYWEMLDEGRINQTTAILLMTSVDEALDKVSSEPLSDWGGIKSNVQFPSYYRFLQMSHFPPKLVTYFTVERLESACYICAAFLRAHRIATRQLHEFIGDSEIASTVINESRAEGEEARKFLEDVRVTFPQVMRVVKTRQVTYGILKHLSDYVQNLEKVGILEEKEMLHLDDAVQTDLKRFLRNPPLVKMPKISDLLSTHPLLGALPSSTRDYLVVSTKELMKLRGVALYKEGSKPNGIWLISSGVVKESSIFIAKLLLPQIFEKMTMQELRALVAEKSTMNIHLRGEIIEVRSNTFGFLLEGFIKAQDAQEDLITSPAVLFPSNADLSFLNLEPSVAKAASFSHQGMCYHVETRARVIFFDIGSLEAEGTLQKRSHSWLHSAEHPGIHRDHGGLMSWPEQYYKARSLDDQQHPDKRRANSLSTKAMELSMFGGVVNVWRRRLGSFQRLPPAESTHSQSYPRIPFKAVCPLVSVHSEGSNMTQRLGAGEPAKSTLLPPLPVRRRKGRRIKEDNSSDESGGEEELIVRIDSPSNLSFHKVTGAPPPPPPPCT
ncbi:Sodium/hydrogen exchanger 7 [Acorus gramineus]|uniref:Sodium/hydrogen exchanger 7 n=1 Tax=Acorus gramineus TaxID=55184 RepID=A0AAV9AI80_ACOGR|nr:Sodium/hydrogen exchanger 7 [Acorus gramineus]